MTTLDLTELYIAPVSDLSDIITVNVRTEDATVAAQSQVRRYAGGRDRLVFSPGETRMVAFTALSVDRSDYLALLDLIGTLALFREPRGRAIYGVAHSVAGQEWQARQTTLGTVSFTVQSVTYDEAV